jgi:hypothetical protein
MFQFGRLAYILIDFIDKGFPIRKSADQNLFAIPRSLSQLITSFIASESQGIPRAPFLTFFCPLYDHQCFCLIDNRAFYN